MRSQRRERRGYRRHDEEFAAREVEEAHGAGAVGVGQQGAVVAPRRPPPLRVRILRHCGRQEKKKKKTEDFERSNRHRTGSRGFKADESSPALRGVPVMSTDGRRRMKLKPYSDTMCLRTYAIHRWDTEGNTSQ